MAKSNMRQLEEVCEILGRSPSHYLDPDYTYDDDDEEVAEAVERAWDALHAIQKRDFERQAARMATLTPEQLNEEAEDLLR